MIDYLGYEYHFPVESIVIEAWPQLILCGPCVNLAASMVLRPPTAHHLVAGNRGGTRESVRYDSSSIVKCFQSATSPRSTFLSLFVCGCAGGRGGYPWNKYLFALDWRPPFLVVLEYGIAGHKSKSQLPSHNAHTHRASFSAPWTLARLQSCTHRGSQRNLATKQAEQSNCPKVINFGLRK
jgi:hypothetical protein